jgi:glutamate decarboxylase
MSLARHVSSHPSINTNLALRAQNTDKKLQVDPDEIINGLHSMHMKDACRRHVHSAGGTSHITPYSTRYASKQEISKFKIPHNGAPADAVHQMLKDELDLDGRPNLNLARYTLLALPSKAFLYVKLGNS